MRHGRRMSHALLVYFSRFSIDARINANDRRGTFVPPVAAMRIAYVVTRAEPVGGVQIHVRDLAIALQSRGHVVTVITSGGGPFVEDLKANHIPTMLLEHLSVPIRPWRDIRALREIHTALAAVKPDLLAAHSSKAGVLGRLAARRLRIPTVLTAHGWSFSPGTPKATGVICRQIERGIGTITSKIITVSECDRRLGIEAKVVPEDRLVAVYNGISDVPESLKATPGNLRSGWSWLPASSRRKTIPRCFAR